MTEAEDHGSEAAQREAGELGVGGICVAAEQQAAVLSTERQRGVHQVHELLAWR